MNFILPSKLAKEHALSFYESIHKTGYITEGIETASLYSGNNTGLMFGFLVCQTQSGKEIILKAFSGKLNGSFKIKGFVNPCFSTTEFLKLEAEYSPELHILTDKINQGEVENKERRTQSMKECLEKTKDLYSFHSIDQSKFTFKDLKLYDFPTGTGDCATIKLLNTALKKGYSIISMAEIFIGNSNSKSDKIFYPPCKSRCSLLLPALLKLDIIYADEDIIAINKPSGLLSVPGRGEDKYDSASVRIHNLIPSSPLLPSVHRLDMDTSGVLVFALNEEAKRNLSMQFENRNVKKTYVALVEGAVKEEEGIIDKPMRLDVENRPYQIIDYEYGKKALTHYKRDKIFYKDGRIVTRLIISPLTGRTHQIRVHLSSIGHPIISDRLYGTYIENERLYLHAQSISFTHPTNHEEITISVNPSF